MGRPTADAGVAAGLPLRRACGQTRVWCGARARGSVTMEVQDVPAIAEAAHRDGANGAIVALDNTYSAGVYFDAFAHGADVTMQALFAGARPCSVPRPVVR